uniref:Uncharacterized protein n=1 Tax=Anguilla anguilla TaxID=7936 RepID=A0A0E9UWB1_ANGAN
MLKTFIFVCTCLLSEGIWDPNESAT